jgi:hypothetical protein
MKRKLASVGLLVVAAFAFVAAQEVSTERNPGFDFSRLRTFAIKMGTSWGDSSAEAAVKQSITKRLEERGWQQADEASCDALVVVHGANKPETIRGFYDDFPGFGWQNVGAPGLADTTDYDYKPGTLMVDIFDAKTKHAVFRGVAKNELSGKSGKEPQNIDNAVKKMFKSLPTAKSGESKSSQKE